MVTIGRAPDCDIRLSDDTVSAHHATLVHKRDGSFELTDMGSRNGVRVNGERVERRMVANGDKIELGAAQFRFVRN
jgi:pSer/pThr/pTyr-binding forkhead associated (FHA) protein